MKLELIELPPNEEARAWSFFKTSPMQAALHNELVKRIESLREKLETAEKETFPIVQAELKAHRFLFGLIHRKDDPHAK